MGITVQLLGKDSLDSQIHVFKMAFDNESDPSIIKEYWEKKHFQNPIHESYIFGAFDGDLLVSINAFMPMRYYFKGQALNVIQTCESGTLPEYRGRGLWSKVIDYAISFFKENGEYDFFIGFPNYKNSFSGFIKLHWAHECDVGNYIFVINGRTFLNGLLKVRIPFSKILEIQRLFLQKVEKNIAFIEYPIFVDKSIYETINVDLTQEFIDWKKSYKKLNAFGIEDGEGRCIGRCTYTTSSFRRMPIILLCKIDVIGENDSIKVYSIALRYIIKKHPNAAFIRTWTMPGSFSEKILKKQGFVKSRHPNPFITYQLRNDKIDSAALHKLDNWCNLSLLDLD